MIDHKEVFHKANEDYKTHQRQASMHTHVVHSLDESLKFVTKAIVEAVNKELSNE